MKQKIFYQDDPILGTYPEYGNRKQMLELFESNKAEIKKFDGEPRVNGKYPNYEAAKKFMEKNPDWQIYTIISKDGFGSYPLFMDRGWHICNCEYKYIAVKDPHYKVMNYKQKIFCNECDQLVEYDKEYKHDGNTVFVDQWTWNCAKCKGVLF
jgi:hypothetical protein